MKTVFIFIVLFFVACASSQKMIPDQQMLVSMQQKVPGITLGEASKGYSVYKQKCAGCHRLHSPSEYTIAGWEKILPEMYTKAKLKSDEEKKQIHDYLLSLSK